MAVSATHCGFPQYGFGPSAGGDSGGILGGGSGTGSVSSSGGGSASTMGGGSDAGMSSGGGGASGGAAGGSGGSAAAGIGGSAQLGGAGGGGGTGGVACVYPTPLTLPAHCSNTSVDGGESGLNCGGSECLPCSGTQACTKNSDCASNVCTSAKTCSPILSMTYTNMLPDAFTRTPKFSLSISYLSALAMPLQTLRIRYYFNHNGVAEPVLAPDTQAQYDPGSSLRDISGEVRSMIYRSPLGPADPKGLRTDSYLEISFPSAVESLVAGTTLSVTTDIVAGSSAQSSQFQQATHYSFSTASPGPNPAITIHGVGDQLLWGVPPPMTLLPDCAFSAGVNLNGPSVSSGSQALEASSTAQVQYSGATYQNAVTPLPATDSGTTTLLHSGFTLGSNSATWPVQNGQYWAYAWLTSQSTASGQLTIQDALADSFVGVLQNGAEGWARVGPYAVAVTGGSVKLTGTGAVNVAGVELYRAAP